MASTAPTIAPPLPCAANCRKAARRIAEGETGTIAVDEELVVTAALLHDMDKMLPADDELDCEARKARLEVGAEKLRGGGLVPGRVHRVDPDQRLEEPGYLTHLRRPSTSRYLRRRPSMGASSTRVRVFRARSLLQGESGLSRLSERT